jgi:hypothetical protein
MSERARSRRGSRLLRLASTLSFAVALAGCERAAAPVFELLLTVQSDTGEPVAGAQVSLAGEPAGASDEEGRLALALRGREGDRLDVQLECPAGFFAEPEPRAITLRRLRPLGRSAAAPLTHVLGCRPRARAAVVLVHAQGARQVPVALDGARVATTDAHGFAHVYVSRAPGARFELTLDTTARRELLPQSPRRSFELADADALFVFEQRFEARARRAPAPVTPAAPPIPTRLH